ncbi:MAG: hypothetical protein ABSH48_12440 [Verrucomicrobiota bacterium]
MALFAGVALASLNTIAFAADDNGQVTTITGMALCAKCALHISDKCQTVLKATVNT